jgi:hypothetical protein
MLMVRKQRFLKVIGVLLLAGLPAVVSADLLQSTNFRLDPNVTSNFGGTGSSASYRLTDAGGEAVVGAGSSQSYKLTQGYIAQLAHSLQLSVMPSGTYAYWPLDTGNGTRAYDVSTTGDVANFVGTPAWGTGKIGQALTFNGTDQYLATTTTQNNPANFTLELWFKTATNQGGHLLGFGSATSGASGSHDRQLYMTDGGQLIFGVNPGSIATISSASSYNDDQWHHVAATGGSGGLTLVIDGVRVGTDAGTTTAGNYTGYWRPAYDTLSGWPSAPTSDFFAGNLDEIRVYSRQLSDAEVKGNYTAGSNGLRFAHTLPDVNAGASTTYSADAIVQTDAGGYDLYIQAPSLLTHTDTTTTMPMMSATIASPAAWTEGVTKGLGFAVTSATQLEPKWGTGPFNYAGVPGTSTVYHSRTGLSGGVPEKTTLQFRADADPGQKSGNYSTTIIYTATLKP